MRTLGVLALLVAGPLAAQATPDTAGVHAAVLDYVNGIYHADTSLIYRSVRQELAKRGYWIPRNASTYTTAPMSFAALVEVARTWNAAGRDVSRAPKEIRILDILDQTASVRLTAAWGVDYMHLARYDGRWMIVNVLWQSPPPG